VSASSGRQVPAARAAILRPACTDDGVDTSAYSCIGIHGCELVKQLADWLRGAGIATPAPLASRSGSTSRTRYEMSRVRYSVVVGYQPMSLAELARFITVEPDFDTRWRLVVEFLKEYHREPAGARQRLLADAPGPTDDERWDVLFAGIAEHLAMRDGKDAPGWSASRGLRRFWFPFDTPGARAQALVHAPAAFRRRGVFVADYEIDAA
jgi:hypothetical protein